MSLFIIRRFSKILEDIASVVCHLSKGAEKGFYGDNSQDKRAFMINLKA